MFEGSKIQVNVAMLNEASQIYLYSIYVEMVARQVNIM